MSSRNPTSAAQTPVEHLQARVRRLVDANIIGIVTWHADGRLIDANDSFLGIIGHDRDDLASGRVRWTDLTPPEWQGHRARAMEEVREAGAVQAREMELFRKDGTRVPVMVGGATFDETPDEGVAFVLDLTERKRAEQAARELHERVAQRTRELAGINAELKKEVAERRRAEEALRASERESRLIVDSIPGLVAVFGPGGELERVNRQILEYYGRTLEELRHWGTSAGAIHPEDLPRAIEVFNRSIASGEPFEVEVRARRFDGAYRWFQSRGFPLRDANGDVVRWYNLLIDIDERKRSEAELRRAYDSFADAQRLSGTGSFITDLVGDDHNWSEQAFRIFEFDPATKVTVQRIRDLVHPEDLQSFDSVIVRGMAGEDVEFLFRIVTPRGAVKHVRGIAHVIEHVAGRPMFVGALQDVTQSKVAEEALNTARSDLAHVARVAALGALTASITHEVSQPLAGIITNASTCLRMLDAAPPNVAGARETAKRMLRDGNRASDVITRLRALFSKKEFTLEPLDLNEATREVIALSSSDLRRNRVILQSQLAGDLPRVTGDRVQLQQVILNLLRNASEAMAAVDDRPRQLLVTTQRESGDGARVTVRDAGVGLDGQSIEKLFEPFYTTKIGGMGIGLSISRSIVEKHQGRLWAEPNEGPGATFSFTIPRAPGDATVSASPPLPARHP